MNYRSWVHSFYNIITYCQRGVFVEYQVLARKCRPQTFKEVVGQEHVLTTLKNAIKNDRIAHAYLFTGSRGVGKTSIARIFAKSLNCLEGISDEPCGRCTSCIEIAQGSSLDVIEIDGASNRKIDQIRELREEVRFVPVSGKFKIYIIDEVHMLTNEAFNALLKTLEEPPGYVKFFFATTEPHKIPITILSRCQRFDLKFIEADSIGGRLREIAEREGVKVEEKAIAEVAKLSGGSMRDAQSVFEKVLSFCDKEVTYNDILDILGVVDRDIYQKLTDAIIEKNASSALSIVHEVIRTTSNLNQFIDGFIDYVRDMLMICVLKDDSSAVLKMTEDALVQIKKQSESFAEDRLIYIIDVLASVRQDIKFSLSSSVSIEVALLKIIKSDEIVSVKEIIDALEKGASYPQPVVSQNRVSESAQTSYSAAPKVVSAPTSTVVASKKQLVTDGELSVIKINQIWPAFVERMKKVNRRSSMFLVDANLQSLTDKTLVIELKASAKMMLDASHIDIIEKAVADIINGSLKAKVIYADETEINMEKKTENSEDKVSGNDVIVNDEIVKKIAEIFPKSKIIGIKGKEI